MTTQSDLKRYLMEAIRDWVQAEHLSQREAARRLGISQSEVCLILKLKSRYGAGRLLDAWDFSGGKAHIERLTLTH